MPDFGGKTDRQETENNRSQERDGCKTSLQDIIHDGLSGKASSDARLVAAALLSINKTLTRLLDTLEAAGGEEVMRKREEAQAIRQSRRRDRQGN